jgi:GTP-binding protein
VLSFLVPVDAPDPQRVYDQLRNEIRSYSEALYQKPHLVVLSKGDILAPDAPLPVVVAPEAVATVAVSAAGRSGLDELRRTWWQRIEAAKADDASG